MNTNPATPAAAAHPGQRAPESAVKPADAKPADAKPGAKSEAKELSIADVRGAFMLPVELSEASAPVRARSEKQQAMDAKVAELHKVWDKAGKPSSWAKMVEARAVVTYFTEPDKSAELNKLVNRAVAFHGLRVRKGTSFRVTEKHVERFNLPKEYVGREAISFAIMDKRPRATSEGKPASQVVTDHKAADKK